MTGIAVGSAAPVQTVPWQRITNLDSLPCAPRPEVREIATWEVAQKYFLDPTFGGALGHRTAQRFHHDRRSHRHCLRHSSLAIFLPSSPACALPPVATPTPNGISTTTSSWAASTRARCWSITTSDHSRWAAATRSCRFLSRTTRATSRAKGSAIPNSSTIQVTCKFQQFRVALGYGGLTRRGFSAASNFGIDAETKPTPVRHRANHLQLGLLRPHARVSPLRHRQRPQRKSLPLHLQPGQHRLLRQPETPGAPVLETGPQRPPFCGASPSQAVTMLLCIPRRPSPRKQSQLCANLRQLGRVLVAYSGGVDSAYLGVGCARDTRQRHARGHRRFS